MVQGKRLRRPHHPSLRLLRGTLNALRRREGGRGGVQEVGYEVRAAQDHYDDEAEFEAGEFLYDGGG
jgi:hypothetical protein